MMAIRLLMNFEVASITWFLSFTHCSLYTEMIILMTSQARSGISSVYDMLMMEACLSASAALSLDCMLVVIW